MHEKVVLGDLPKLKRSLGLTLVHIFCTIFHKKYSLFNNLRIDKVSVSYFFPFQDIKQNVLKFSFRQRKQEEKMKIQKSEYLENEKRFLDEVKRIFHNYLRAIIC